jgi:VWFA-related protein
MAFRNTKIFLFMLLGCGIALAQSPAKTLQFSVIDTSEEFVEGLVPTDIRISLDNTQLQIKSLVAKKNVPLDVLFLIDTSISQETTLPDEKAIAKAFIDYALRNGLDKVTIVTFSEAIALEQDLTNNLAAAKTKLENIKFVAPTGYIGDGVVAGKQNPQNLNPGATSLYSSIMKVVDAFAKGTSGNSRKIIIVISDGINTAGEDKLTEAVSSSVQNQIPIYAIGISNFGGGIDEKSLKKLCEQSNGVAIFPKVNKQNSGTGMVTRLATTMRNFYEVSFGTLPPAKKASIAEIDLDIIKPDLRKSKLRIIRPKGIVLSKI